MSEAPDLFLDGRVRLHAGDCLAVLRTLPPDSLESCVTDPPYHLTSIVKRFGAPGAAAAKIGATGAFARASRGFMGQQWDGGDIAFQPELWAEVLRVLKPGGHVLAFSATRTYHRMACAIEDAGFEIRDMTLDLLASETHVAAFLDTLDEAQRAAFFRCVDESGFGGMLAWIYGSGFPKSHDVAKGIDKAAGVTRTVVGRETLANDIRSGALLDVAHGTTRPAFERDVTVATSADAQKWEGWGTALKPAFEPICLARKPLCGTVAANVLAHGTGALNVAGCRVGTDLAGWGGAKGGSEDETQSGGRNYRLGEGEARPVIGRWPANVVHDGSDEVVAAFPTGTSGGRSISAGTPGTGDWRAHEGRDGSVVRTTDYARASDSGSAARFFYSTKADADDRIGSKHPTVKPVDLMRWLVRLVTPPGGAVLDPFAGTGTTGEAAWREGLRAVLIEREAPYRDDIARRMALCLAGPDERKRESLKARHAGAPAAPGPLFALEPAE